MPLQRRLPKFGFKPLKRVEYRPINLETLELLATEKGFEKIGLEELMACGLVSRKHLVKILAKGQLSKAITVEAHAFSKTAEQAIEQAGGKIVKL